MEINISTVICDCGHLMEQDDDAAWTCFNDACKHKGRTLFPEIRLVELKKEKAS